MQHRPKTRLTIISAIVLTMLIGPSSAAFATTWGDITANQHRSGQSQGNHEITDLTAIVDTLTTQAKAKIDKIRAAGDNISIADMFDMQMNMNHLAQMSEKSTSIVNATNTAVMSMARNIKG